MDLLPTLLPTLLCCDHAWPPNAVGGYDDVEAREQALGDVVVSCPECHRDLAVCAPVRSPKFSAEHWAEMRTRWQGKEKTR